MSLRIWGKHRLPCPASQGRLQILLYFFNPLAFLVPGSSLYNPYRTTTSPAPFFHIGTYQDAHTVWVPFLIMEAKAFYKVYRIYNSSLLRWYSLPFNRSFGESHVVDLCWHSLPSSCFEFSWSHCGDSDLPAKSSALPEPLSSPKQCSPPEFIKAALTFPVLPDLGILQEADSQETVEILALESCSASSTLWKNCGGSREGLAFLQRLAFQLNTIVLWLELRALRFLTVSIIPRKCIVLTFFSYFLIISISLAIRHCRLCVCGGILFLCKLVGIIQAFALFSILGYEVIFLRYPGNSV